jgi:hypothetical protein
MMPRAEGDVQKIAAYVLMGIGDRFWVVSWRFWQLPRHFENFWQSATCEEQQPTWFGWDAAVVVIRGVLGDKACCTTLGFKMAGCATVVGTSGWQSVQLPDGRWMSWVN